MTRALLADLILFFLLVTPLYLLVMSVACGGTCALE